jgi:hypothetical protein
MVVKAHGEELKPPRGDGSRKTACVADVVPTNLGERARRTGKLKTVVEKSAPLKVTAVEAVRGSAEAGQGSVDAGQRAADQKTKKTSPKSGNSNPYSMEFGAQGVADGGIEREDAVTTPMGASPPCETNLSKSQSKVDGPSATSHKEETKVNYTSTEGGTNAFTKYGRLKLLIFNVHGTLLDCGLLSEKNPNSTIKSSVKTKTHRVVFRPWLKDFLSRCFKHFAVAFWGSKSESYTQEIVPAMLAATEVDVEYAPLFVWSGIESEPVDFHDGTPIAWGKPLERVFQRWPCWNHSNTMIIDHKPCRVAYNPPVNFITPSPFYVEDLQKIGDDQMYLKSTLWAGLQRLLAYSIVTEFILPPPSNVAKTTLNLPCVQETGETAVIGLQLQGEGTCEPCGST